MDHFETYTTTFPIRSRRLRSSTIPGVTLHPAIYSTSSTTLRDNLISFLSYVKTRNIPILPVTKPDVRSVLGQGASFLVNGAEIPETYTDPTSGAIYPQGKIVAFKRAVLSGDMHPIQDRIRVLFNEILTMQHPPLLAHPNIVNLYGIAFETENTGLGSPQNAMPVLILEVAELGNLAEVLETARKEERPLRFEDKLSMCLDIAHGLEILHACDIVHGDVKCENILVFEDKDISINLKEKGFNLCCKLTDFGCIRLPDGGVLLGGSRPWQAPECSRGAFFKLEEAKRTDVYSFGMLIWRVFLNGDPFNTLGEFQGSHKEQRQARNDAIALLKDQDQLVQHVCCSLALSENFSRPQLEMLCEIIGVTLIKESGRRELDITRLIRLLTPDNWYQPRHPVPPERIPADADAQLLDMEKWHSEFANRSPLIQGLIASGFKDYAEGFSDQSEVASEEKRIAAAYQLAICYANGFGVHFEPDECLRWLTLAANGGSQKAHEALPMLLQAFNADPKASLESELGVDDVSSMLSSSWVSDLSEEDALVHIAGEHNRNSERLMHDTPDAYYVSTLLNAAENCNYDVLDKLLSDATKPTMSEDGVSPIHFLSSWDVGKAHNLGLRLIKAGANVNAVAKRGTTVGGTPLMWAVYGAHQDHAKILVELGAEPMISTDDGEDALSFAARLHLAGLLRHLLENTRPIRVRGHMSRLIKAALGGESRFKRMTRHGEHWITAAAETIQLLKDWHALFTEEENFTMMLLPALEASLTTPYGRMNTDVQVGCFKDNHIEPSHLTGLLRNSVTSFNAPLFNALLDYGVPVTATFEHRKTLLHLCAKIPDHSLASQEFAPRLLELGAHLDALDENGTTPWMDAILNRKWDLTDLLLQQGADPLITDNEGFDILGLCINAINLGSIKFLFKYCKEQSRFLQNDSFVVNKSKQISALQLAAAIPLPRAHAMKLEVIGTFLAILGNFGKHPSQLNFRSDGILPNASALDVAASIGNVHAVKSLVKNGAHLGNDGSRASALRVVKAGLEKAEGYMERKNLERCKFIIEHWDDEGGETKRLASDWTNMRTIDESHVNSSWEVAGTLRRLKVGVKS